MKEGHFLGRDQNSGGTAAAGGSSLAVRQFVDLARGWVAVHTPATPFRVESVTVEERYCLRCCAVHNFDVVRGAGHEAAFCRCCGMEVQK